MLASDILRKIRRIEITTRHVVTDVLAGQYHSVFKGRGMEFDEVRPYQPGDEVRTIDWNVTARTGQAHVKKYVEERELTVLLLVDASGSGVFGSRGQARAELAAEVCGLLAFSAIRNHDRVGLIVFTGAVELYLPPSRGSQHVLRLIREVLAFEPRGRGTSIDQALEFLGRVTTKRAVVFLVSDFFDQGYERRLRSAARRHDLVAVPIVDPLEEELPDLGLIELEDAETGATALVDTSAAGFRRAYAAAAAGRRGELREKLAAAGVDRIELALGRDYVAPLVTFFRRRARRLAR